MRHKYYHIGLPPNDCDMASIKMYDHEFKAIPTDEVQKPTLLNQIKRIEREAFPKNEAMDFDFELKKRNTEMIVVLARVDDDVDMTSAPVAGYLLHARVNGIALLHKLCVADVYRRRGIGKALLDRMRSNVETQGCQRIQLWVEFNRPAIALYTSMGFRVTDQARDYYGLGRHGNKMVCDLNYVW